MQKVIHVITTASRGGAENHLLHLASSQVKNGKCVMVVYLKGDGNLSTKFHSAGVHLVSSVANRNPIFQVFLLRKLLRRTPEAIVHSHLPRAELVATFASVKMFRTFSRHNSEPFYPGAPKLVSSMLGLIASFRVKQAIAISNAVKAVMITHREVSSRTKINVVHYALPNILEEDHAKLPKIIQDEINWLRTQKKTILCTVARLVPQKDYPTLLSGLQLALESNSKLHLLVAGEGNLESELRRMSDVLGISDHITWLGNIENPRELMRQSDLFILTSLYEGFGLVLLEAIQSGCPVVAAKNSAIPEVLGSDYEGLFSTGNSQNLSVKILELLDPKSAEEARMRLSKQLLNFTVQKMELETSMVYSKLEIK